MAQINFFATRADILSLLVSILEQTDLRMLEMYSEPGERIREYRSLQEFEQHYPPEVDSLGFKEHIYLTLWSPSVLKRRPVSRIEYSDDAGNSDGFGYEAGDSSAFYLQIKNACSSWVEMSWILFNSDGREDGIRNWKRFKSIQRTLRKIVKEDLGMASAGYDASRSDKSVVLKDALRVARQFGARLVQSRSSEFEFRVFEKDA